MDELGRRIQLGRAISEQLTRYLGTLSAPAWRLPTAFADWQVRDIVGHLTMDMELYAGAIDRGVRGDDSPFGDFPPVGSLDRAALAAFIIQGAIARRKRLGRELLATFAARSDQLHCLLMSLRPQDRDKLCYHPEGVRPARRFVVHRLTELAIHEWDIGAACGVARPLFAGSVPIFMEEMPTVIAERFRPGDRLPVPIRYRFALTGAVRARHDLIITGDAVRWERPGASATHASCRCDAESFVLLVYGRLTLGEAVASGRVEVEGDPRLVTAFGRWF